MSLYLTVEIRHDPAHMTSPPYKMLMNWCASNSIPLVAGWMMYVYNEQPVRAVITVIDLDGNDEWVMDPDTGEPVTHEVTYTCSGLPPVQGYMSRGSSTLV